MPNPAMQAALFALVLAQGPMTDQGPQGKPPPARFAVVIHCDNPMAETGTAAKNVVKQLFLKELTRWPAGTEAKVYARAGDSESMLAFRKAVLGMTEAELARHWLKQKSMTGTTPPKEVETDRLVLKYVAKNPQAFGIVSVESLKDAEGVKVLFEF